MRWNSRSSASKSTPSKRSARESGDSQSEANVESMSESLSSQKPIDDEGNDLNMSSSDTGVRTAGTDSPRLSVHDQARILDDGDDDEPDSSSSNHPYASQFEDADVATNHSLNEAQQNHSNPGTSKLDTGPLSRNSFSSSNFSNKRKQQMEIYSSENSDAGLDSSSTPPHPALLSSDSKFDSHQQLSKSSSDPGMNNSSEADISSTSNSITNSNSNSDTSSSSTPPPASAAVIDEDDPGLDHALPPDECAGSLTPTNVWRPQSQQSTCEFTHTIQHYSQKRESGCKKAEYSATTVDVHGNRWRLIVYVNGNGRASNHHLSLFLQVADADELPFGWKKAVSYVLTLEHPSGTNLGYAKRNPDKTFKLCPKAIDWGWSQFITSDRIQQEGYVHNDSLIVRASVTVKSSSVSIDVDDAELYLKCAVEEGNADAVKACLAQGAGVNCQFKDDLYTPLHTACSSSTSTGSLEVLKLLLERGADGNACNKWRETPLLIAANNGHKAAVEALLEHGADPSLCSEAGWSALTFAAHKGYDEIVSLLLAAGAPVNCKVTEDLSTPLHKACAGGKPGHLSAVRQLLQGGADVHALNKWRETPLLTAANHGQAAAVEALLRSGGDPCKCTDTGWSPLSIAAYKGHDDVVRLLLEEGAPTEEADPTLSALLQAATKGLPDTVELLLRHGADHTVTTKKGDTALSILVEQNLIDSAVEMVTEYKASVPRCSRDRKKVQRARLLINLRVKQQQKEGLLNGSYNSEGETESDDSEQDESDNDSNLALHRSLDAPITNTFVSSKKKKKKKNKGKTLESAEAEAKAAEEALLLELEKEDEQAQKEEAAATSKRAKKKKKRERERQQKLKEERMKEEKQQKARILKEAEEKRKQQLQRAKEKEEQEKQREALERKLLQKLEAEEKQHRLLQELQEREKKEQAKKKEKELIEKKTQQEEKSKREVQKSEGLKKNPKLYSPQIPHSSAPKTIAGRKKEVSNQKETRKENIGFGSNEAQSNLIQTNKLPAQNVTTKSSPANKRGWEIKPQQMAHEQNELSAKQSYDNDVTSNALDNGKLADVMPSSAAFSVEDELENMANGVVDFLGFDSPQHNPNITNNPHNNSMYDEGRDQFHHTSKAIIELPSVSVFQEEKVAELLQRSLQMGVIADRILRAVIYRYMIRAAHSSSPYLDPVIPSWIDKSFLVAFLQRQLISENRKVGASGGGIIRMELLKEVGTTLADLCLSLAKDVSQFRSKCIGQVPSDWTDDMIGLRAEHIIPNGHESGMIMLAWSNRQVQLSAEAYHNLGQRYCGPQNQFLTAVFTAAKRYETRRLVAGSYADLHLTQKTMATLQNEAKVSIEIWANPLSVFGNNDFLGAFPDVDGPFQGFQPFGKEGGGGELYLSKHGGSVSMLPPPESATAEAYVRTVVDLLKQTEIANLSLSFALILPHECFRELTTQPTMDDLRLLDPRLSRESSKFIVDVKPLREGQHVFLSGDRTEVSKNGSLFVLLQNQGGKLSFPVSKRGVSNIIQSLSLNYAQMPTSTVGASDFSNISRNTLGSNQQGIGGTDFFSNPYNVDPPRMRRGRIFELEENGEDETGQDVEAMTGMYANLNMSMFQNNSQDVDIENLALMGIGEGPTDRVRKGSGRFG